MGLLENLTTKHYSLALDKGIVKAFDELYLRYAKNLMAFFINFLYRSSTWQREAVQEIFVRIWGEEEKLA